MVLDNQIAQIYAKRIAKLDGRPEHPEDYVPLARTLLEKHGTVVIAHRIIDLQRGVATLHDWRDFLDDGLTFRKSMI